MAFPALRNVVTALVGPLLVSCILVVSPERFGDTCRFSGRDTQCGACIADRCQAQIDDCCRDAACEGTLHAIESCAGHGGETCSAIGRDAGGFAVARCAAESCGAVCVARQGTSQTSCKVPLLGESAACLCRDTATGGNDFVCNAAAFPQTVCCAPDGWPAVGLECGCRAIECNPTTDGCFCLTVDSDPRLRECSGLICCAQNDSCSCGTRACFAFQTRVPSCNLAAIGCKPGQIRVDSCSVRTP